MLKYLFSLIQLCSIYAASWVAESVDVQVTNWRAIHAAKREIPEFSNTTTNLPQLLGRLEYMAGYVKAAVSNAADRVEKVDKIIHEANTLRASETLTFQVATRLFDGLALACDQTKPLEKERFTISPEPLGVADFLFICTPKGGLKFSRLVDGYLIDRPEVYIVLPNQHLDNSPHGNLFGEIYDFYGHDRSHALESLSGEYWHYCIPAYKRIKNYRDNLGAESRDAKILDAFLFHYFNISEPIEHCYGLMQHPWEEDISPEELQTNLETLRSDISSFLPFVEKMKQNSIRYKKNEQIFMRAVTNPEISDYRPLDPTKIEDQPYIQKRIDNLYGDLLPLLQYCGVPSLPSSITLENLEDICNGINRIFDEAAVLLSSNA